MTLTRNRIFLSLLIGILFTSQISFATEKKLKASDAKEFDEFGYSTDIDGNHAIIGAPGEDNGDYDRGSVYIFNRNAGGESNWGQLVKLTASDADASDLFGMAVAIDGDHVVAGARFEDNSGNNSGAAYIFNKDRDGTDQWGEVKKIVASDAGQDFEFGFAVAINEDYLIVGSPGEDIDRSGAAYIYNKDKGGTDNWGEVAKLKSSDPEAWAKFGSSVAISGDYAIVGAYSEDSNGEDAGTVYVYYKNKGGEDNWGLIQKIIPDDIEKLDEFGYSVSIFDDIIAVGAHGDNIEEHNEGSVYLYRKDFGGQDNWGQTAKLLAGDRADDDQFGISVSLSKDFLLIGAHGEDTNGKDGGAAYLFYLTPELVDHWWQFKKFTASDGNISDFYGFSVAVDNKNVVIGAFLEDGNGKDAGAAYLLSNEFEISDTEINLSAIGEDQKVILSWSPSPSSNTINYQIYRGTNAAELSYLTTVAHTLIQFDDNSVSNGITYFYKIVAINDIGSVNEFSNIIESTPQESTLGTELTNTIPERFIVSRNYPNPFNPVTSFTYSIPSEMNVRILIYDMLGHEVKKIINSIEQPGTKLVTWDATDDNGRIVSGGVYFYQVSAGKNTYTGKMLLLK